MAHRALVTRGSLLVIGGLLAGLASCSPAPNSATAAQSSATPAATAPAATPAASAGALPAAAPMAAATAIASAQYSDDPSLRADLLEVKRVSGGALLIRWRLVDTAGGQQGAGLVAAAPKAVNYGGWSWADLYYTDPAENKKYGVLTDTEGNRLLDVYSGDLQPGQERDSWSKFPAPPATSTKVTIYIPKFPPFEDTPIS
jgi:hypothetical protein